MTGFPQSLFNQLLRGSLTPSVPLSRWERGKILADPSPSPTGRGVGVRDPRRRRLNRPSALRGAVELHGAVVHVAEAQVQDVENVVLVELPGALRALFGEAVVRSLDVA